MAWLTLRLQLGADRAEQAADWLHEHGALSITLEHAGGEELYEPPLGATPLWRQTTLSALFPADTDITACLEQFKKALGWLPPHETVPVADRAWERVWLEHFRPMQFGKRLWICPSHHEPPQPTAVNVRLDPGLAFGTGTHATTRLCLEWLDAYLQPGMTVLDYGCGSGILAIAALKLGASQAWAVDLDPQALLATQENAQRNGVGDRLHVAHPDALRATAVDVVLANILLQPLLELAPRLVSYCRTNLVLSGILTEQADSLALAYQKWIDVQYRRVFDGWCCIAGKRHHGAVA